MPQLRLQAPAGSGRFCCANTVAGGSARLWVRGIPLGRSQARRGGGPGGDRDRSEAGCLSRYVQAAGTVPSLFTLFLPTQHSQLLPPLLEPGSWDPFPVSGLGSLRDRTCEERLNTEVICWLVYGDFLLECVGISGTFHLLTVLSMFPGSQVSAQPQWGGR